MICRVLKNPDICSVYTFQIRNLVCRIELPYSIPKKKRAGDPLPPTGGINMGMLEQELVKVKTNIEVKWDPEKFPGLRWTTWMDETQTAKVTFTFFIGGRGVVTGLKEPTDNMKCNAMLLALPHMERGREFRRETMHERGRSEVGLSFMGKKAKQNTTTAAASAAAEPLLFAKSTHRNHFGCLVCLLLILLIPMAGAQGCLCGRTTAVLCVSLRGRVTVQVPKRRVAVIASQKSTSVVRERGLIPIVSAVSSVTTYNFSPRKLKIIRPYGPSAIDRSATYHLNYRQRSINYLCCTPGSMKILTTFCV
jgi:hypothetical protein